ncbi:OmpH family outer membrane protein [Candidatus Omnitrophota bacterium]
MRERIKKIILGIFIVCVLTSFSEAFAYSEDIKIGYVDIRKAFYEYERTKTLEEELTAITEDNQVERKKLVEELTQLNDEGELLSGKAKAEKQKEVDAKFLQLQDFDKDLRQKLLNKKNDMFREVIDDIQKVSTDMGEIGGYDFIIDSRNIMYANEKYDLTEEVIKRLNKQ